MTPTGTTEPWVVEDAVQSPGMSGGGARAGGETVAFADLARDEDFSLDDRYRRDWLDDPLTISSNDTVPMFGLAPPRQADPEHKAPLEPTIEEPLSDTRTAWLIAGVALLATLALATFLLLTP